MPADAERRRLEAANLGHEPWRLWGPYVSERQWGTVREDYSANGDAWGSFPHDHARSRAYRWGEDGIAGISDENQRLCFALALWNGKDPFLKERLFGLTGPQGNHGEDVKELYWYLDATPTSSWLEMLYKYPLDEYPYEALVEGNRRRTRLEPELELLDTGLLDDDRYVDVFVRYAKAAAKDILIEIAVTNRAAETARVVLLPQLWFRNVWAWGRVPDRPRLTVESCAILAEHPRLDSMWLVPGDGGEGVAGPELLFCDNDTNAARLWGSPNRSPYPKDAFHDYVVHARHDAVNPHRTGTKAGVLYRLTIPPGDERKVRLRLSDLRARAPFADFDATLAARRAEADAFYAALQDGAVAADPEIARVERQALAGMLWSKQFYDLDVPQWLEGDPGQPPPPPERKHGRNSEWFHLNNSDVLSMPDKWEFPWYASWDLAFHCLPLARIDPEFAKGQLVLLTREWYMHPNGQLPAYEWKFSDVNPPVHAWATWRVFEIDRELTGRPDHAFLERIFHKLLLNFTWWVNRKDAGGRNVFQGGFLGLDNIGAFDRSAPLPNGGRVDQADATGWMAMYCLNLMRISLELARKNSVYQDVATKFFEHFLYVAAALSDLGGEGFDFWNEKDEFFYDVLSVPGEPIDALEVRSMVGLIPIFAVEILDAELLATAPEFARRLDWFLDYRPDLASLVSRWAAPGRRDRRLLSLLRRHRLTKLLECMLDEREFLSPHGIRALSRHHAEHPFVLDLGGRRFTVSYQPGESESDLFGGNSNWRGPVWFPLNFLIVESLRRFRTYYGNDFLVECPTGSGQTMNLDGVADEISRRLLSLFLPADDGTRPAQRVHPKMASDPHFRDYLNFWEHFHGDTGRGLGASHQTGWTGLVAELARDLVRRGTAPPGGAR